MNIAENKSKYGSLFVRLAAVVLAALLIAASLPVGFTYAAADKGKAAKKGKTEKKETTITSEEPIREVHKVRVGKKKYCFFVTHNVVMTPEEIASFGDNDEKLTKEILKRSGLYMKEANCKVESHKAIDPKAWKKSGGTLSLGQVEIYEEEVYSGETEESDTEDPVEPANSSDGGDTTEPADTGDEGDATEPTDTDSGESADTPAGKTVKMDALEALRMAAPSDGEPVRIYADLVITTKTSKKGTSGEPKKYSTFKKKSPNSPKLIYIAVATEKDAKLGEEICVEKKPHEKKEKEGKIKPDGEEEEMLPELRSISMTDRSGGPIEPTLKEGDPVTLEWKEPGKQTDTDNGQTGFFDHAWAIPALAAAALLLAAALVLILRRRKETEDE